jgi:dihydrofolate synthase/folylpolyglutamate synthase
MTYSEAIEFLLGLRLFGAKLGLENPRRLAALAGDPQARLRFIHVAGTNGKGSTCAFLEGIYRHAGLRVGLYTSPHLVSFTERIQVNRQPIPEAGVARLVSEMQPLLKEFPGEAHPTFFEVVTLLALRWYAEQQCDLVIWETGLGGRLDATNIVTPLASVITNIEPDHQRWLGETLDRIAFEKAGIIKPGVPAITGATVPEALAVIEETARACRSLFHLVTPEHTQHPPLDALRLPLLGWHQRMNAAVALAAVAALQGRIPVGEEAIKAGLLGARWPGRLQLVESPDRGPVLLDGAHNAGGVAVLRAALAEHFPGARPALVLGIMQDKDWDLMCGLLAPVASRILCVPVSSERTAAPADLLAACHRANPAAPAVLCSSLAEALQRTAAESFTVVAGSLYLIGEAMELLHVAATPAADEKSLNEWGARRA